MGKLRSFRALNKTAPTSPSISLDANADFTPTDTLQFPCSVVNFDGFVANATGGKYFMIFDKATAPVSTTTVPLKVIYLEDHGTGAAQPLPSFLPSLGPVTIRNGLWFAISAADDVYTSGDSTEFSVWGEVEEFERQPANLTKVTITAEATKQIWANSAGPRNLVRLVLSSISAGGSASYLQMFATNSVSASQVPLRQWPLQDTNGNLLTSKTLDFGGTGSTFGGALNAKGCFFAMSSTSNYYTADSGNMTGYALHQAA